MYKVEMIRLSKLMSEQGICSRREADRYIEKGEVLVDGKIVSELGTKVDPAASITLKSSAKRLQKQLVTVALHKSIGYVSSPADPDKNYPLAHALLTPDRYSGVLKKKIRPRDLHVAGRLDIDSSGLLILTEDGRVARALVGENSSIEKEYHVDVEGDIREKDLELLRFGLSLDGKPLKPAGIDPMGKNRLRFILKEGKKRQIRRMCEAVGLHVKRLMRVRIGALELKNLKYGTWRVLSPEEIQRLTL